MGWFGRLTGAQPPRVPPGGRAFTSDDHGDGSVWQTRITMNGEEPLPTCRKVGPAFTDQVVADQYLDWVTGEAPSFEYPTGAA